jgi:hypothetical protein
MSPHLRWELNEDELAAANLVSASKHPAGAQAGTVLARGLAATLDSTLWPWPALL